MPAKKTSKKKARRKKKARSGNINQNKQLRQLEGRDSQGRIPPRERGRR